MTDALRRNLPIDTELPPLSRRVSVAEASEAIEELMKAQKELYINALNFPTGEDAFLRIATVLESFQLTSFVVDPRTVELALKKLNSTKGAVVFFRQNNMDRRREEYCLRLR